MSSAGQLRDLAMGLHLPGRSRARSNWDLGCLLNGAAANGHLPVSLGDVGWIVTHVHASSESAVAAV